MLPQEIDFNKREVVFADTEPHKKTVILGHWAVKKFADRYMLEYKYVGEPGQGKYVKRTEKEMLKLERFNRSPIILAEVLGDISRNNIHLWKQCIIENKDIKVRRSTAEALALEFNSSIKLAPVTNPDGTTKYIAHFFSYIYDYDQLLREFFYSYLPELRSDEELKKDFWDPKDTSIIDPFMDDIVPGYKYDSTHYRSEMERKIATFKYGVLDEWMKRMRGGRFNFDYEILPLNEYVKYLDKPLWVESPTDMAQISMDLHSQGHISDKEHENDMRRIYNERQAMKNAADAYAKTLTNAVRNIDKPIPVIRAYDLEDFNVIGSDAYQESKFHYKLDEDVSKNLPTTLFGMSIDDGMVLDYDHPKGSAPYELGNILICDHHYVPKNDEHVVVCWEKIDKKIKRDSPMYGLPFERITIGQLMAPKEFWSLVQEAQARGDEHMDWDKIYLHRWRIKDDVDIMEMFNDGWRLKWMFPICTVVHGL